MGYTIFGVALCGGQFVVAGKIQLVISQMKHRVRAPHVRIGDAATRSHSSAPLIGEHNFCSVIGKRSRVPIGIVRIVDGVYAFRIHRVFDVEHDAIAGAGSGGQSKRRVHGNIVTLVGVGWLFQTSLPCVPPLFRPLIALVRGSINTRGLETTLAVCGAASGTLMTSMRNSAVFGSLSGASSEHPGNSSPCRTNDVPET